MLRYKNSLLERILLEKGWCHHLVPLGQSTDHAPGIDVQGELRLKGSPHLRPIRPHGIGGQPLPMQKAMLNRQQSARQRHAMAPPPIQTVNQHPRANVSVEQVNSPLGQPTPPSQRSSPSAIRSPAYPLQGLASPTTDIQPRQQFSQSRPAPPISQTSFPPQQRLHNRSMSAHTVGQSYPRRSMHVPVSQTQANYYPPSFQKHYDQLGKSTSSLPFPFLSGSFVRPRLIPLVQIKSTMHKPKCLMTTLRRWIQTASFPIFDYLQCQEVTQELGSKHLRLPRPVRPVMQAIICRLSRSIMTLCWTQTHSDSAPRCIFLILLAVCSHHEGDCASISLALSTGYSAYLFGGIFVLPKILENISDGVHGKVVDCTSLCTLGWPDQKNVLIESVKQFDMRQEILRILCVPSPSHLQEAQIMVPCLHLPGHTDRERFHQHP